MKGSVYRRPNGRWEYRFDLGPDPLTGRRRETTKTGFHTERDAAKALRVVIAAHDGGRRVTSSSRTVQQFLDQWHAAVQSGLRATTWVNYRDYLDVYVIPIIGKTRLQDLTPVRLNLLYGHLLTKGQGPRRRGPGTQDGAERAPAASSCPARRRRRKKDDRTTRYLASYRDPEGRIRSA